MKDIDGIIQKAQNELFPQLEAKIRAELKQKNKDWLIDQIIFLTCERHSLQEQKRNFEATKKLISNIQNNHYNNQKISNFTNQYQKLNREEVQKNKLLINPPHMGLGDIESKHLSLQGQSLLNQAKEILYVLLYGDKTINASITREHEKMLILTLPKDKSFHFSFLKAVTELNCYGTWNDPEGISNDSHANNIELQVEFGDDSKEQNETAIFTALNIINLLLINEQVFYARTTRVEKSSLTN